MLENGLADLSLRPVASAVGTSPQILLYYFGSKDALVSEVVAAARTRMLAMLAHEVTRATEGASSSETLWRIWRWFTAKQRAPFMRLFFEVWGLALQHPERFREFLESGRQWLTMVEQAFAGAGFSPPESAALATLYLDSLRGILLDYLVTRDGTRIDAAIALIDRNLARDLRTPRRRR